MRRILIPLYRDIRTDTIGGIETWLTLYLKYTRLKNEIRFVYHDSEVRNEIVDGVNFESLKYSKIGFFLNRKAWSGFAFSLLRNRKRFIKEGVQIVLANLDYACIPFLIFNRRKNLKILYYNRGATKNLATVFQSENPSIIGRSIREFSEYICHRKSDAVFFVSENECNLFKDNNPRFKNKFRYIPVMVDIEELEKHRSKISEEDSYKKYFVFSGRLSPIKQVDLILKAFVELKELDCKLYIVGDGPDFEKLKNLANDLELVREKTVVFTGFLRKNQLFNLLSRSTGLVLASRSEGKPNSVLEALALGIPCVVPNLDSLKSFLTDKRDSFFFENGSVSDLSNAIRECFHNSRSLRDNCIATALNFDARKVTSLLDTIIGGLLDSKNAEVIQ